VFDRFRQADALDHAKSRWTGTWSSIVRSLTELHGSVGRAQEGKELRLSSQPACGGSPEEVEPDDFDKDDKITTSTDYKEPLPMRKVLW